MSAEDARRERRVRAVREAALLAQDVEEARGRAAAERLVRDDGRGEPRAPPRERGPREEEVRLHGARAVHEVDREAPRRGGGGTAGAARRRRAEGRRRRARPRARSASGSAAPARTSVAPANERLRRAKSATSSRVRASEALLAGRDGAVRVARIEPVVEALAGEEVGLGALLLQRRDEAAAALLELLLGKGGLGQDLREERESGVEVALEDVEACDGRVGARGDLGDRGEVVQRLGELPRGLRARPAEIRVARDVRRALAALRVGGRARAREEDRGRDRRTAAPARGAHGEAGGEDRPLEAGEDERERRAAGAAGARGALTRPPRDARRRRSGGRRRASARRRRARARPRRTGPRRGRAARGRVSVVYAVLGEEERHGLRRLRRADRSGRDDPPHALHLAGRRALGREARDVREDLGLEPLGRDAGAGDREEPEERRAAALVEGDRQGQRELVVLHEPPPEAAALARAEHFLRVREREEVGVAPFADLVVQVQRGHGRVRIGDFGAALGGGGGSTTANGPGVPRAGISSKKACARRKASSGSTSPTIARSAFPGA